MSESKDANSSWRTFAFRPSTATWQSPGQKRDMRLVKGEVVLRRVHRGCACAAHWPRAEGRCSYASSVRAVWRPNRAKFNQRTGQAAEGPTVTAPLHLRPIVSNARPNRPSAPQPSTAYCPAVEYCPSGGLIVTRLPFVVALARPLARLLRRPPSSPETNPQLV
ncbi:hypothetical protein M8818_000356 [Zalaria obscura]|uniref:Uncharacterized protein n=1 Tax=Zalaria obscura TaxID=2024903 RepID=A0ACC3SN50_9PEZI